MNIVRVVTPPALIEQGRSMQYANREALNAKSLSRRITSDVRRRKKAHKRLDPQDQDKAGGKLEFVQQKAFSLWTRRRSFFPPSYFLRPQDAYDEQGRLAVETSTDQNKFTEPVEITPLVPVPEDPNLFVDQNTTFLIQNNTLYSEPRLTMLPSFIFNIFQYHLSAELAYQATDSQALQPDSFDCSLEAFIELPDIERQPIIEQDDSDYIVTSYTSFLRLQGPHFSVLLTKNVEVPVAPGFTTATGMIGPWRALVLRRDPATGAGLNSDVILGATTSVFHFAVTYSSGKLSVYFNGQRLAVLDHQPVSLSPVTFLIQMYAKSSIGRKVLLVPGPGSSTFEISAPYFDVPFKISRFRLTFDSIYSGETFTPPTTIAGPF